MIRRLVVALVIVAALAGVAAIGGWSWVEGLVRGRNETAVPVSTGTIQQWVVAIGRVEPVTEVTIANKIPGRINAVLVKEGDTVTVGQRLIQFDDAEFQAQVRMARARVATTEAEVRRAQRGLEAARARHAEVKSPARREEVETARADLAQARQRALSAEVDRLRYRRLVEDGFVARSQYNAAETEAEVARSKVKSAEEALKLVQAGPKPETIETAMAHVREADAELRRAESHVAQARAEVEHTQAVLQSTVVLSTVGGRVTRKLVEPGEAVDISAPLVVLGDTRKIIIKAEVDETDVGKLALGQKAMITADAYPGRTFPGTIYEMGQTVGKRKIRPEDPTRMQDMKVLETKIEITEGAAELKLGMTVDVKVSSVYKDKVLVIPKRLVPAGAKEATVRVAGPGGGQPRAIKLGVRDDEKVEVTAGLSAGDKVLVANRP